MGDQSRVEVLCEDKKHEAFARRLLERMGVGRRRVHVEKAPSGKGAASRWVMDRYAEVRRRARAKRHQLRLGFLVIVDGDSEGRDARFREAHPPGNERSADERVALWIPTWSIETWVLWLNGADVDESTPLKHTCRFDAQIGAAITGWDAP